MNTSAPIAALAAFVLLATFLAFLGLGNKPAVQGPPPAAPASPSVPPNPAPAFQPVMVEAIPLSPGELEALADLYKEQGADERRTFTGLFDPGESMLCDIFEDPEGSQGLTFLTVAPHQTDSAPAQILFRQQTVLLRADGSADQLSAPTIVVGENQEGTVTIGRGDSSYSMSVRGLLVDEEQVQVSVEFRGQPPSPEDLP